MKTFDDICSKDVMKNTDPTILVISVYYYGRFKDDVRSY